MSPSEGVLPDLLIIGAQKAGTTSLHRYLGLHPEVFMSAQKELDFFSGPGWNWDRGVDWYCSHFEGAGAARVRGEASPSYSMHPWVRGVPERVRSLVPDARLIYMVRDPIERILSQYVHYSSRGYVRKSIDDLVAIPDFDQSDYVCFSRYASQLERYLDHFPTSRVLVVAQEDLRSDQAATLRRVFGFLGVDPAFESAEFARKHNISRDYRFQRRMNRVLPRPLAGRHLKRLPKRLTRGRPVAFPKPELSPQSRALLTGYLKDDADRLRALTGREFRSWSL